MSCADISVLSTSVAAHCCPRPRSPARSCSPCSLRCRHWPMAAPAAASRAAQAGQTMRPAQEEMEAPVLAVAVAPVPRVAQVGLPYWLALVGLVAPPQVRTESMEEATPVAVAVVVVAPTALWALVYPGARWSAGPAEKAAIPVISLAQVVAEPVDGAPLSQVAVPSAH